MKNEITEVIDFREHFNTTGRESSGHLPKLTLKDGTTLSVQASAFNYSTPRKNISDNTLYSEWEIGFPSVEIPEINSYAEDSENYTETVYGWVPYEVIQKLINSRGGIVL